MSNIKNILKGLGGLGIILGVGAVLILVFGILSISVQWLWSLIPFGIAGFILGLMIIVATFYFSKRLFPERKLTISWQLINELEYLEVLGYLYGTFLLIVSFMWFILPNQVLNVFPTMKESIGFYMIAPIFLYGIGACFQGAIKGFYVFFWGGLFWLACAIFGLYFVNYHIWSLTEKIPGDYYLFGKAVFAFILFVKILYIIFFHIIPALSKYHQFKNSKNSAIAENLEK